MTKRNKFAIIYFTMTETNSTPERLLEDPKDRFYKFAQGLFGRLKPEQLSINLLGKETERKTAIQLDNTKRIELVSVFEDPEGSGEVNDQYSLFLNTAIGSGQYKREVFTIDASAYERKNKGEVVDPADLMIMTVDSARSEGHELDAEMQLLGLLDDIETIPIESWYALPSAEQAA